MNGNLTPQEMVEYTSHTGEHKAHKKIIKTMLNGYIAGTFIGLAAFGSLMASQNLLINPETYGIGKLISGIIFASGLVMVLIAGGELFTGNSLLIVSFLNKEITLKDMFKNWTLVYLGNLLGCLTIVGLVAISGLIHHGDAIGIVTLKMVSNKVNNTFMQSLSLGILCNILVAVAVWMSYATKDVVGKIWAVFFPVMLFVLSGYEHSIANMFYIPMGMILKPEFTQFVLEKGVSFQALSNISIQGMISNLIPVTIGNIIGGCLFIGVLYWYSNRNEDKTHTNL